MKTLSTIINEWKAKNPSDIKQINISSPLTEDEFIDKLKEYNIQAKNQFTWNKYVLLRSSKTPENGWPCLTIILSSECWYFKVINNNDYGDYIIYYNVSSESKKQCIVKFGQLEEYDNGKDSNLFKYTKHNAKILANIINNLDKS